MTRVESVIKAGDEYVANPMEVPFMPTWNRVRSACPDLLDDFYEVFAQNMRDLGTPVYAKQFFELVLKANPDNAWISAVHVHGKCVAAGFLPKHRDRMEIPWA